MMNRPRIHEWAWGDVERRTVCGLVGFGARGRAQLARMQVVHDLGAVDQANRCRNCERMRAAIGTSSAHEAPSGKLAEVAEAAAEVVGTMSEREQHIAEHTTGWLSRWPLYRNHFCAGEGHDDWSTIQAMITRGLMRVSHAPSPISGGDTVFCVTAIGIAALRKTSRGRAGKASKRTG